MVQIDWGAIFAQGLGAFLSTLGGVLVGIILFLWKTRAENRNQLRDWYDQTIRYAEHIERIESSGMGQSASQYTDNISHAEYTLSNLAPALNRHLLDAPLPVSSELLDRLDQTARACKYASDNQPQGASYVSTYFDNAYTEAEKLRKLAGDERREKVLE